MVGRTDDEAVREQQEASYAIGKAEEKEMVLTDLHHEISTQWAPSDNRVVGRVVFSPAIAAGVGPERYTRDIAVIPPRSIQPALRAMSSTWALSSRPKSSPS